MTKNRCVQLVLCAVSVNAYCVNAYCANANADTSLSPAQVATSTITYMSANGTTTKKFGHEPFLLSDEVHTYIIEFTALPVARASKALQEMSFNKQYRKRPKALSLTNNPDSFKHKGAINEQKQTISAQQQAFIEQSAKLSIDLQPLALYLYGINGMAVKLNHVQAQMLSLLPQVKSIKREKKRRLNTDRGPTLIGAPKIWDGSGLYNTQQTHGEGVVIGIIDSGINTDHPSFAEVAGDGYVHSNPFGDGNFLGDCAGNFPHLCNNKLIGVYSYPDITNNYNDTSIFPPNLPMNGQDYGGHGSHVAGIAAGNILYNVDEVFPSIGEIRSAGTPTGFTFGQISGVAPRANIISYQACFGGTNTSQDTYADCVDSAILKAIEDAIKDEVDIINFSISGGNDPWGDPAEQALLSARNAGIFVAVSAGNEGPDATTSQKTAPWYSAVAASEHGRENLYAKTLGTFSGGASVLQDINGQSNTGSLTASIVYAGDFSNANDPTGDPAQCLMPFPANTFNGQIVVCDRGNIARVQKAINVRSGGAGGYVLANLDGAQTVLANDQYVIPGIHINAANANALKAWLRTGQNHLATISSATSTQVINETRVDVMASYSSRGPSASISTLVPTMTAPGSSIFAAYADEQLGHDGHEPAASNFTTQDGTSMASPHVAGAAALLKAVHPQWTPDEIRSALALTANNIMQRDSSTNTGIASLEAADFFDMGSGRIQVNKAVAAGLVMNETGLAYSNANPDLLGDPRSLNLPSINDNNCAGICTWTRTFTATTNATFAYKNITITPDLVISASPSRFTLLAGESQVVTFTIDAQGVSSTEYAYALATFTSPGLPDLSLPVAVLASYAKFPEQIKIEARRSFDSVTIENISAVNLDNLILSAYKPVKAISVKGNLDGDSDRSDYLDDVSDGVAIYTIQVPENAKRVVVSIHQTTATDLDLYLLLDNDNSGQPTATEEIARSTKRDNVDELNIHYPQAGTYFIALQNFSASAIGTDTFDLRYAIVTDDAPGDSLQLTLPSTTGANADLGLTYHLPSATNGDTYYAALSLASTPNTDEAQLINLDIHRIANDVLIEGVPTRVNPLERAALSIRVKGNTSNQTRSYKITLPVPVGTRITDFSTSNAGTLVNNEIVWFVDKPGGFTTDTILNFTLEALQGAASGPIAVNAKSELVSLPFAEVETSEDFMMLQIEGSPTISFENIGQGTFTVTEAKELIIPLIVSDPNFDDIDLNFSQIAGPLTSISIIDGVYSLQAPLVENDTALEYELSVKDTNNNVSTAFIRVNVLNNGAPIINMIDAPRAASPATSITISVNASDPENDTLQFTIDGRSFSGASTTVMTPSTGNNVSYIVSASDGISQTQQTVSINLTQDQSSDSNKGGGLPWFIIGLLPLAIARQRRILVNKYKNSQ